MAHGAPSVLVAAVLNGMSLMSAAIVAVSESFNNRGVIYTLQEQAVHPAFWMDLAS